jgi:hypothetical protein
VAGKRLKGLTQLDITAQPNSRSRAEAKLRDYLIIRVDNITQPHGEELLSSVAREILFFELQVCRKEWKAGGGQKTASSSRQLRYGGDHSSLTVEHVESEAMKAAIWAKAFIQRCRVD